MFKVGDKVVYQWDPTKYYGRIDGYKYGVDYSDLENGTILTVDYVLQGIINGTVDEYFFETVEFGSGQAFVNKYFIPLHIYQRKEKLLKIKERLNASR